MKRDYVKDFLDENDLILGDKISVEKNVKTKKSYQVAVIRTENDNVRYVLIDEAGLTNDRVLCELMSRWYTFVKFTNIVRDFRMGSF